MVDHQRTLLLIAERLLPRHSTLHPTMMVMNRSTRSAKKALVRNQKPAHTVLKTQIMTYPQLRMGKASPVTNQWMMK